MTPKEPNGLHAAVFRNTAKDPIWLGYWLARHQQTEDLDEQQIANKLGIAMDNLASLCLCRTPRTEHFREDLHVVCRHTGADELGLANILRQEQNLHSWKNAEAPPSAGWLMAASDRPPNDDEPPIAEEAHD